MESKGSKGSGRWLYMAGLMLAGESIYMLPYMRKTFQTSMESVFQLSSTEVGLLNSIFGVLALICYFPSGRVADRFSVRSLLTVSLMATGLGGGMMILFPSFYGLLAVHAFWGITSILTFWSALIKATRNWGSPNEQGKSFGLLDAGRGAVAAILASLATLLFAYSDSTHAGLYGVIAIYSAAPFLSGILLWYTLPDELEDGSSSSSKENRGPSLREVLKWPAVWTLAAIVFCAYLLYLGSYELPAFAEKGYDETKTFGATLGTIRDWMRPIAAIAAGLIADRFLASRTVAATFGILLLSFASMAFFPPDLLTSYILWAQVILIGLGVFGLRGIYFAILEEVRIPRAWTGTVVGIVSFIGFTPDLFGHFLSGWFADHFEGVLGYRYYFAFLALVALIGGILGIFIRSRKKEGEGKPVQEN